ncbi:MAG: hypothetical protein IPJ81_10435 [Chitinophagaceae bacterium]|nr:hypothetical protein [Chitinophagaceae bacterium]
MTVIAKKLNNFMQNEQILNLNFKTTKMKKIILSICVMLSQTTFAQKQAEVNLELHDGNVIKGTASFNDIDLTTALVN